MIKEAEYTSYVDLAYKSIIKYDENGNKIEKAKYNSDGSLWYKQTYKYDENGNEIEGTTYDSNGELTDITLSEYIYYK